MRIRSKATGLIAGAGALYAAAILTMAVVDAQQNSKLTLEPTSEKALVVPEPPNLADFVADKQAAIVLGKAMFWDQQASSDNAMACASCHFHAGADDRVKNQVNPGQAGGSNVFDLTASGSKGGPNSTLTAANWGSRRSSAATAEATRLSARVPARMSAATCRASGVAAASATSGVGAGGRATAPQVAKARQSASRKRSMQVRVGT